MTAISVIEQQAVAAAAPLEVLTSRLGAVHADKLAGLSFDPISGVIAAPKSLLPVTQGSSRPADDSPAPRETVAA